MRQTLTAPPRSTRLVEYDALRRRVWILGQRCHHGATGTAVAALAFAGLVAGPIIEHERLSRPPLVVLAAAGWAMMAHDWKDRTIWFERGYGSQP